MSQQTVPEETDVAVRRYQIVRRMIATPPLRKPNPKAAAPDEPKRGRPRKPD